MDSQPTDKENNNNKRDKVPLSKINNTVKGEQNAEIKIKEYVPIASRRAAGSNWQLAANGNNNNNNNNLVTGYVNNNAVTATANYVNANVNVPNQAGRPDDVSSDADSQQKKQRRKRNKWCNRYVAMDCEMVGIGFNGEDDMLARVSIVNRHGSVLMDKYVKPTAEVIDYRTSVSGIRPADIEKGEDFDRVQHEVINMLQDRVLVGHGLRKDLSVLKITHPFCNIRDTSSYKPLARLVANGRTPSLKRLVHCLLGQEIQNGEHDSVEDARAAMNIYNTVSQEWEKYLQRKIR